MNTFIVDNQYIKLFKLTLANTFFWLIISKLRFWGKNSLKKPWTLLRDNISHKLGYGAWECYTFISIVKTFKLMPDRVCIWIECIRFQIWQVPLIGIEPGVIYQFWMNHRRQLCKVNIMWIIEDDGIVFFYSCRHPDRGSWIGCLPWGSLSGWSFK